MCGIIGYVGNTPAEPVLVEGLRRLAYRGYDSSGVASVTPVDGALHQRRAAGKLEALEALLEQAPLPGTAGIAHTRWATHGPPTVHNAHPHQWGRVTLVHNGIIENHDALRSRLGAEDWRSDTDTEVLARLLNQAVNAHGDIARALPIVAAQLEGAWAMVALDSDAPGTLGFARRGSPLLVGFGENGIVFGSDEAALAGIAHEVLYLEDGDWGVAHADDLQVFNVDGEPADRPRCALVGETAHDDRGAFDHHMHREIHEQPHAVRRLLDVQAPIDERLLLAAKQIRRVVIVACGTSRYAGLVGEHLIEQHVGLPVEVELASEFRYRAPIVDETTLVIGVSQSGETADTLAALEEAARRGARVAALCNVERSAIARFCNQHLGTVFLRAGREVGVASTKAFTAQVAGFARLAEGLAAALGLRAPDFDIASLPAALERALALEPTMEALAEQLVDTRSAVFVGRGLMHPIALEGALKLKEISYIHAEGFAAGELKHGPLALLEPGVPVIATVASDASGDKARANLAEAAARGAEVIAIAPSPDGLPPSAQVILLEEATPLVQALMANVLLQLLAYHAARFRGCDVDQPRNLAKSVTVE